MRVLGLDVGEKTIGVAVSDGLGISAQGVLVIRRQSKEKDMAALLKIIEEYEAGRIIIGLPKNMDGSLGPQAEKALAFAEMLKKRFGLPVEAYDERLSTVLAQKALIEGGASRAKRKTVIDMLAAQVILQGWLDRKGKSAERNILNKATRRFNMKYLKLMFTASVVAAALFLMSGMGFSDEQAAPAPSQDQAAPDQGVAPAPDQDQGVTRRKQDQGVTPPDQDQGIPAPDNGTDQTPGQDDEDNGGSQDEQPAPDEPQTFKPYFFFRAKEYRKPGRKADRDVPGNDLPVQSETIYLSRAKAKTDSEDRTQ